MLRCALAWILSAALFFTPAGAFAAQGTTVVPTSGPLSPAGFAAAVNTGFLSIMTNSSGPTPPANSVGNAPGIFQFWLDTSTSPRVLRMWDGTSWVSIGTLDTVAHAFSVPTASVPSTKTGTSYNFSDGDKGNFEIFNNAALVATTLPAAGSGGGQLAAGWYTTAKFTGAGGGTIAPLTGTIDGQTSIGVSQLESIGIYSDGVNYHTTRGLGLPTAALRGGLFSSAAVTHQFLTGLGTDGVLTRAQPAASDLTNGVSGSGAVVLNTAPAVAGGTFVGLTGFGIRSTGSAFDVRFAATEVLTADRTVTWVLGDAARSITMGGNINISGNLATVGGFGITLTAGGTVNVTLPVTGTLATLLGPETFQNKTIDTANNSLAIAGVAVTANTGTGAMARAVSPVFTTPTLGVAAATSINKVAFTTPATGATATFADGKTFTNNNTITLNATDGAVIAFGGGGTVPYTSNNLSVFASTTSAQLAGVLSDETGSGLAVFNNAPTLITPILGVATATSLNKVTITQPATSATLTITDGKTAAFLNSLNLAGTDGSSIAFGAGGTVAYVANNLSVFASTTSAQLAGVISDETGSGALVFANSPAFVTPGLGVANATSINKVAITAPATGSTLTITDGKTAAFLNSLNLSGTDGANVVFGGGGTVAYLSNNLSAFAATSSAQLASVLSDETGTGLAVFNNSPSLTTPTASAAILTGLTDLQGAEKRTGVASPASIGANQNDYNPSSVVCATADTLRLTSSASFNITGFAGVASGCQLTLFNIGANPIVLKDQDAGSSSVNRLSLGGDATIAAGASYTLRYDGTTQRWRALLTPGAGGGGGGVSAVSCAEGALCATITSTGTVKTAFSRHFMLGGM